MSRDKLLHTHASSPAAKRLREAMLNYHDFQQQSKLDNIDHHLAKLAHWQSERLKFSHRDFYQSSDYQDGLSFLFTDLYSTEDFSDRDRDLERIFPKMIKLLPKKILETVSLLVELNLLTQQLDQRLAEIIFIEHNSNELNEKIYCEAYRASDNHGQRLYQIQLTSQLGQKLDKYARSSVILFTLRMTEGAAEMAGLQALHQFLMTGFEAFHSMKDVRTLMNTLSERETVYLDEIYQGNNHPFNFDLSI
ncbi:MULTISPECIES: hypothetical protein [unclassified Oleiphilus]|jgi:hypothetical protein|nr:MULTISPECIES: hypothetical protein [unclassified Oleiphilus]KZY50560.1 hypothetical protein A3732_04505 [Oleiphilus sp. HI0050]KZY75143.1 hypothetical protein A3741_12565 [Oleiphilus sp. HI0069]KZZ16166.1 hypothetical protein A3749_04710 [Oleiphilus sp. HI0078]KZZ18983.1 hypothetical protein A3752_02330 [Oleiphilus sp. HI0081]KZZ38849.1 hypothetical protein A3756_09420 [Oleiphilus sp. HI0086]